MRYKVLVYDGELFKVVDTDRDARACEGCYFHDRLDDEGYVACDNHELCACSGGEIYVKATEGDRLNLLEILK